MSDASEHLPPESPSEKKVAGDGEEQKSGEDKPNSPPADLAALIDAIKNEGIAYRKEEEREDRGKKFREWITIGLLVCTVIAVAWQVLEMVKVYGPIRDQAQAAIRQAENSERALIASQRAWVGPLNASISSGEPKPGAPVEFTIQYQNSGHDPATDFSYFLNPFLATQADIASGRDNPMIKNFMDACKITKKWDSGSVVYPTATGYVAAAKTGPDFVDAEVVSGTKTIIVEGCFLYRTFKQPRHSYFCYFYKQGMTKAQNLNICHAGHDAD
jgi:hypothetical protein